MILYRLLEDWHGLFEGICLTEEQYRAVYYTDKVLFEPIQDFERKHMLEWEDDNYCNVMGVECLLFWTEAEVEKFLKKLERATSGN